MEYLKISERKQYASSTSSRYNTSRVSVKRRKKRSRKGRKKTKKASVCHETYFEGFAEDFAGFSSEDFQISCVKAANSSQRVIKNATEEKNLEKSFFNIEGLTCSKCEQVFLSVSHLHIHNIFCGNGNLFFPGKTALTPEHEVLLREPSTGMLSCPWCPILCRSMCLLEKHLLNCRAACKDQAVKSCCTREEEIPCPVCFSKFENMQSLFIHSQSHYLGDLKCSPCQIVFNSRSSLVEHLNLCNSLKSHICSDCCRSFQDGKSFKTHVSNCNVYLRCLKCACSALQRDSCLEHMKLHIEEDWKNMGFYVDCGRLQKSEDLPLEEFHTNRVGACLRSIECSSESRSLERVNSNVKTVPSGPWYGNNSVVDLFDIESVESGTSGDDIHVIEDLNCAIRPSEPSRSSENVSENCCEQNCISTIDQCTLHGNHPDSQPSDFFTPAECTSSLNDPDDGFHLTVVNVEGAANLFDWDDCETSTNNVDTERNSDEIIEIPSNSDTESVACGDTIEIQSLSDIESVPDEDNCETPLAVCENATEIQSSCNTETMTETISSKNIGKPASDNFSVLSERTIPLSSNSSKVGTATIGLASNNCFVVLNKCNTENIHVAFGNVREVDRPNTAASKLNNKTGKYDLDALDCCSESPASSGIPVNRTPIKDTCNVDDMEKEVVSFLESRSTYKPGRKEKSDNKALKASKSPDSNVKESKKSSMKVPKKRHIPFSPLTEHTYALKNCYEPLPSHLSKKAKKANCPQSKGEPNSKSVLKMQTCSETSTKNARTLNRQLHTDRKAAKFERIRLKVSKSSIPLEMLISNDTGEDSSNKNNDGTLQHSRKEVELNLTSSNEAAAFTNLLPVPSESSFSPQVKHTPAERLHTEMFTVSSLPNGSYTGSVEETSEIVENIEDFGSSTAVKETQLIHNSAQPTMSIHDNVNEGIISLSDKTDSSGNGSILNTALNSVIIGSCSVDLKERPSDNCLSKKLEAPFAFANVLSHHPSNVFLVASCDKTDVSSNPKLSVIQDAIALKSKNIPVFSECQNIQKGLAPVVTFVPAVEQQCFVVQGSLQSVLTTSQKPQKLSTAVQLVCAPVSTKASPDTSNNRMSGSTYQLSNFSTLVWKDGLIHRDFYSPHTFSTVTSPLPSAEALPNKKMSSTPLANPPLLKKSAQNLEMSRLNSQASTSYSVSLPADERASIATFSPAPVKTMSSVQVDDRPSTKSKEESSIIRVSGVNNHIRTMTKSMSSYHELNQVANSTVLEQIASMPSRVSNTKCTTVFNCYANGSLHESDSAPSSKKNKVNFPDKICSSVQTIVSSCFHASTSGSKVSSEVHTINVPSTISFQETAASDFKDNIIFPCALAESSIPPDVTFGDKTEAYLKHSSDEILCSSIPKLEQISDTVSKISQQSYNKENSVPFGKKEDYVGDGPLLSESAKPSKRKSHKSTRDGVLEVLQSTVPNLKNYSMVIMDSSSDEELGSVSTTENAAEKHNAAGFSVNPSKDTAVETGSKTLSCQASMKHMTVKINSFKLFTHHQNGNNSLTNADSRDLFAPSANLNSFGINRVALHPQQRACSKSETMGNKKENEKHTSNDLVQKIDFRPNILSLLKPTPTAQNGEILSPLIQGSKVLQKNREKENLDISTDIPAMDSPLPACLEKCRNVKHCNTTQSDSSTNPLEDSQDFIVKQSSDPVRPNGLISGVQGAVGAVIAKPRVQWVLKDFQSTSQLKKVSEDESHFSATITSQVENASKTYGEASGSHDFEDIPTFEPGALPFGTPSTSTTVSSTSRKSSLNQDYGAVFDLLIHGSENPSKHVDNVNANESGSGIQNAQKEDPYSIEMNVDKFLRNAMDDLNQLPQEQTPLTKKYRKKISFPKPACLLRQLVLQLNAIKRKRFGRENYARPKHRSVRCHHCGLWLQQETEFNYHKCVLKVWSEKVSKEIQAEEEPHESGKSQSHHLTYQSKTNLEKVPWRRPHSKGFMCPDCKSVFPFFLGFKHHRVQAHGEKESLVCHLCKKKFDHIQKLAVHYSRSHAGSIAPRDTLANNCNNRSVDLSENVAVVEIKASPVKSGASLKKCKVTSAIPQVTSENKLSYSCPMCLSSFDRKVHFKQHVKKHKPSKFICPYCHSFYFYKKSADVLLFNSHVEGCKDKNKDPNDDPTKSVDLRARFGRWTFICFVCSLRFKSKFSLCFHLFKKHGGNSKDVEDITESNETQEGLSKAGESVLTKVEEEEIHSSKTMSKDSISAIQDPKHQSIPCPTNDQVGNMHDCSESVSCPVCGKLCKTMMALSQHLHRQHDTSDKVVCPLCKRKFNHMVILKGHHEKMHKNNAFDPTSASALAISEDCMAGIVDHVDQNMKMLLRLGSPSRAEMSVSSSITDSPIQRDDSCGSPLTKSSISEESEVKCNYCHKIFNDVIVLKSHMCNARQKKLKYKCHSCGLDFRSGSALSIHDCLEQSMEVDNIGVLQRKQLLFCENGQNPNDQESSVAQNDSQHLPISANPDSSIESHQKGLKKIAEADGYSSNQNDSFTCVDCHVSYKNYSCLKRHRIRVHKEAPKFKCPVCGTGFSYPHTLKIHMQRHHKRSLKKEKSRQVRDILEDDKLYKEPIQSDDEDKCVPKIKDEDPSNESSDVLQNSFGLISEPTLYLKKESEAGPEHINPAQNDSVSCPVVPSWKPSLTDLVNLTGYLDSICSASVVQPIDDTSLMPIFDFDWTSQSPNEIYSPITSYANEERTSYQDLASEGFIHCSVCQSSFPSVIALQDHYSSHFGGDDCGGLAELAPPVNFF